MKHLSTLFKKGQAKEEVTYILHFNEPLGTSKHSAMHYVGKTTCLEVRLELHRTGKSNAKIMRACYQKGIGFTLARIWHSGKWERRIKRRGHYNRYCSICRERELARHLIPTPLVLCLHTMPVQEVLPLESEGIR